MMTLAESNRLVGPLMGTDLFKRSTKLQAKCEEIREMLHKPGGMREGPFGGLSQLTILSEEAEAGFKALVKMYEEERTAASMAV